MAKKETTTRNYTAIAFCRVSSEAQDYDRQISDITAQAVADGHNHNNIYVISEKESAVKMDYEKRKGIQEMKRALELYETIRDIYVTEVSRLGRRHDVLKKVLGDLEVKQVALVVLSPKYIRSWNYDSNGVWRHDDVGNLVLELFATFAVNEIEIKKERQKSGIVQKKLEGKCTSGKIAFGYIRDKNGFLRIDEEKKVVVADIFNSYLEGETCGTLWAKYKFSGYFNARKKDTSGWNYIGKILRNKAYIGQHEVFKYPPIIDERIFNEVQIRLSSNVMVKARTKFVYYAQGLLKYNGYSMTPSCTNCCYEYRNLNDGERTSVNLNVVDSLLWGLSVEAKSIMGEAEHKRMRAENEKKLENLNSQLTTIGAEMEEINARIKAAGDIYVVERNMEAYKARVSELETKKAQLEEIASKFSTQRTQVQAFLDAKGKQWQHAMLDYNQLANITDDATRKQIIQDCIEKVVVKQIAKGKFELHVNYKNAALNNPTFYRYTQSGCKIKLICVTPMEDGTEIIDDWSNSIEQRVKRTIKKK